MSLKLYKKERINYVRQINELLAPKVDKNSYTALDLFAGCGGLGLGFEACGFRTIGFESNDDCCKTYSKNLKGQCTISANLIKYRISNKEQQNVEGT